MNKGGQSRPQEPVQQGKSCSGANNPFNPIEIEEGELADIQEEVLEVRNHDKNNEVEVDNVSDQQKHNKMLLVKSSSADHLSEMLGKDHMDRIPLIRSNSMSDIPAQCKESRLEYLREEFKHYHLIAKHLQKTKEDTLQRLKIMELRQTQAGRIQEDIQQYMDAGSQLDLISQIPETQMEKPQAVQAGETSQRKKKGVPVGKKPLTRATKKQLTPRRS